MRILILATTAAALVASTAAADLNVVYKGTSSFDGKESAAETRYSIAPGRIAVVELGERKMRMVYLQKDDVLRVVDDTRKTYVDFDAAQMQQMHAVASDAKTKMDEAMAQMTPEQRKMMEGMMPKAAAGGTKAEVRYETSDETAKIKGYDCTRVDVLRGEDKKAEYWGTMSKDFALGAGERETLEGMKRLSERMMDSMSPLTGGGGGAQGLQWDARAAGFPIVTRCFNGDKRILDLTLESFNRKPVAAELFEVPKDYAKQDLSMGRPSRSGRGLKNPKSNGR